VSRVGRERERHTRTHIHTHTQTHAHAAEHGGAPTPPPSAQAGRTSRPPCAEMLALALFPEPFPSITKENKVCFPPLYGRMRVFNG